MLSFALTVALAAPCGIPKQPHHHSHIAAEPVQTCAAPPMPMCFRDPPIDPIEIGVYPYYSDTPVAAVNAGAESKGSVQK